jgi:hypothetical protein
MKKYDRRNLGFSLVELLLIVSVVVLLGAVGNIVYRHISDKSASSSTQPDTLTSTSSDNAESTIPESIDPVNPAAIPLGDSKLSTKPEVGYVDSCQTTFPSTGGAEVTGPWINTSAGTWNSDIKPAVEGAVAWPNATYNVSLSAGSRIITGNDLPINHDTGVFPISSSDPAYKYDTNPNSIVAQHLDYVLSSNPVAASQPSCLSGGPVGILNDGVVLFDALDGEGRDAAAHEILDSCQGHPMSSGEYHHHDVPSCILDKYTQPSTSTLVGYALDGYGIYVERDKNGNLLTDANLDACHGRTSEVMWNGKLADIYHYDATLEYPYTLGCFHGTPIAAAKQVMNMGPGQSQGGMSMPTQGPPGAP